MGVSENRGTPKSSILIKKSIINHPFWGITIIFGNTHIFSMHFSHNFLVSKKNAPDHPPAPSRCVHDGAQAATNNEDPKIPGRPCVELDNLDFKKYEKQT